MHTAFGCGVLARAVLQEGSIDACCPTLILAGGGPRAPGCAEGRLLDSGLINMASTNGRGVLQAFVGTPNQCCSGVVSLAPLPLLSAGAQLDPPAPVGWAAVVLQPGASREAVAFFTTFDRSPA